jgi:hypothetical protein
MGNIDHLRNPCKNIFPTSNMHFISFCPIPLSWAMILTNLPSFYVRKLSCKIQLFWLHSSKEEDFKRPHPIFTYLWLSPLWRGPDPLFELFVSSLVEIDPVVLEKIFKRPPSYFHIFVIISPLKRTWPFIWSNLNFLHPRIICTKSAWIWFAGSGDDF